MPTEIRKTLLDSLNEYSSLGIADQLDYTKFSLYSIVTHSTAIEGSTVTELENQLLFDDGLTPQGRNISELMMNMDLKRAYEYCLEIKDKHIILTLDFFKSLSAMVMKNTGSEYKTAQGNFSAADGTFRLLNVTAGKSGRSYMNYLKVPQKMQDFCTRLNQRRQKELDCLQAYELSFDAHFELVTIHPWADGNGRVARLLMNFLQFERHLVPVKIKQEQKSMYIQALIDTQENDDLNIFRQAMFTIHLQNIQHEIDQFKQDMSNDFISPNI